MEDQASNILAKTAVKYLLAQEPGHFNAGKKLFLEYAASLGIDLSFQDFDHELLTIAEQYNKPSGALILLCVDNEPVGCIAIRKLEEDTAEIKRMFIRAAHRGAGYGKELLDRILARALELRYKKVRLDTLPDMTAAQEIYKKAGFYVIHSFRHSPILGTIYLEKQLDQEGNR
jgi:putative acetyltransferase